MYKIYTFKPVMLKVNRRIKIIVDSFPKSMVPSSTKISIKNHPVISSRSTCDAARNILHYYMCTAAISKLQYKFARFVQRSIPLKSIFYEH